MRLLLTNVICRNYNGKNENIVKKFDEFDVNEKTTFYIIVLCNYPIDAEKNYGIKIWPMIIK